MVLEYQLFSLIHQFMKIHSKFKFLTLITALKR